MNTDPILTAVEQLRKAVDDGPTMRKELDALFRHVHNLKANASAHGLNKLAAAAHEFENVLQSMRTGVIETLVSNAIPADVWSSLKQDQRYALQQSIADGARLFMVEANFEIADFDREFQQLKEALIKTGEVISTSPSIVNESPRKISFKILYSQKGEATPANTANVGVEEISTSLAANPSKTTTDLQAFERAFARLSTELASLPVFSGKGVLEQAVLAGRAAAVVTSKDVDFEVRGADLVLDGRLVDPLIHLVRNAVDHGIESGEERMKLGKAGRGKIVIEATTGSGWTRITVTDDGRGIDPALQQQIFRPGFSTASEISEISGRGVGLDAVKTGIEEAGGSISVCSEVGRGSTFEIALKR